MGEKAQAFVRDNFLLTRHLGEYLTLMVTLTHDHADRVEL
jgi:trehalose synthase